MMGRGKGSREGYKYGLGAGRVSAGVAYCNTDSLGVGSWDGRKG